MDKYIFDENNGLWYERQGDYYIPCLTIPAEEEQPIGLWGRRHLRYIKEHRKARYTSLLLSSSLILVLSAHWETETRRRRGMAALTYSQRRSSPSQQP